MNGRGRDAPRSRMLLAGRGASLAALVAVATAITTAACGGAPPRAASAATPVSVTSASPTTTPPTTKAPAGSAASPSTTVATAPATTRAPAATVPTATATATATVSVTVPVTVAVTTTVPVDPVRLVDGLDADRVLTAVVIITANGDIDKAIAQGYVTSAEVQAAVTAISNGTVSRYASP